jgi:iron complex outermembrane recepter protein
VQVKLSLSICVLLITAASLCAQSVNGTVLDVGGKPIAGAAVSVRNDSTGALRMIATDAEGKFFVSGMGEGSYTVEASSPSFSTSRRAGVILAAGTIETVTLALNVSELSQSITVEGTVSLAAETSPSQNTLEARSAKSEISP